MRRFIILSGGDWHDAGFDLINVPDGTDLEEMRVEYNKWYQEEYVPALNSGNKIVYLTFAGWLINRGATKQEDVEEFWDD